MNGYQFDSDMAFHFDARRQSGQVVLNTRFGGVLQADGERRIPKEFEDTVPFEIKFIIKKYTIEVGFSHLKKVVRKKYSLK